MQNSYFMKKIKSALKKSSLTLILYRIIKVAEVLEG